MVFIALLILFLAVSPNENSLGSTIKYVYLHVSLIWCGSGGLILVTILILISPILRNKIYSFNDITLIGLLAISSYSIGFIISLISAKIAWGSIYWQEPHLQTSIIFITIAVLSIVFINLFPKIKLMRYLYCLPGIFYILSIPNNQKILHPDNPIGLSNSPMIKLSFALFFLLFLSFFTWLFLRLRKTQKQNSD